MKSISLKLLLLVSLLVAVFRQNIAVPIYCTTNEDCRRVCHCDAAYCDIRRNQCYFGLNAINTIDDCPSKQHCIPEDKNCGRGRGGFPPRRLKL
ncbi:hypothetical protein EUTSA_v10002272mg [Eutrema salsugineum]|uniref:Embryo surrounding factor 1 brassicaceae domain-containing protein n=1 Tax=Eutrema salsugineum TaxID=72664 RepID=V4M1Y9_EUTSA|nr:hypothetical protein EUTSA_v10002272mg [Eutrema salsugineum]